MNRGLSLVELMVALSISSIVMLILCTVYLTGLKLNLSNRSEWLCMQSIRATAISIDNDLMQCAYLLPQDMKVVSYENNLYISGAATTSEYSGLNIKKFPPPLYAVVESKTSNVIKLDTVDLDDDDVPDFRAGLGIITENGATTIKGNYSKNNEYIPVESASDISAGDRAIPAVHYEFDAGSLYRNNQLIADHIETFNSTVTNNYLEINIRTSSNGKFKDFQLSYPLTQ